MTQMHLGWHFCKMQGGTPVLRDGSLLVIGKTYEHTGMLMMCESGYHDSHRVLSALRYASGPYLCRTLASRDLVDFDKHVSRYRRVLVGADITKELQQLTIACAYGALMREREAGREPDARSWNAVAVAAACLCGEVRADAAERAASAARDVTDIARRTAAAAWHVLDAPWRAAFATRDAAYAAWDAVYAARNTAYLIKHAAYAARHTATSASHTANQYLLSLLPETLKNPAMEEGR